MFNRKSLLESLRFVSLACNEKSPMEVLRFAMLKADGESYTLKSTDNELFLSSAGMCETEIHCLIPVRNAISLLESSSDEDVEVSLVTGGIQIKDSSGKYKLLTPPIDEFPDRTFDYVLSAKTDSMYIGRAMPLLSCLIEEREVNKYAIEGVRIDYEDGKMVAIGTDSKRLCRCNLGGGEIDPFTLPMKAVGAIRKLDGAISVGFNGSVAAFVSDTASVVTRVLDGKFPAWKDILLADKAEAWSVTAADLSAGLKKCSVYSQVDTRGVDFKITQNGTSLSIKAADVGSCVAEIPGSCESPRQIKVDGERLRQFVSRIPSILPSRFSVGERINIKVGDFCDFTIAGFEE